MKLKINLLMLLFVLSMGICCGQDYSKLANVRFKTEQDYLKHEPKVIEIIDQLLSGKYSYTSAREKQDFGYYLIRWANKNPRYDFTTFGNDFGELTNSSDDNLLVLYFICFIKATLNANLTDEKIELDEIHTRTKNLFLDYCLDKNNEIKKTNYIKKELKKRKK